MSYYVTAFARLISGISAGVLWPMISAYAMRLVPEHLQGRAIAITMSGSTFGLGIGLPIMTTIGTEIGWRVEFAVLTLLIVIITIVGHIILPSIEGEQRSETNSPMYIIRNKSVMVVLIVTFFTIMAHYGLYTYMAPLAEELGFIGGIKFASILFGIGTFISVILAAKIIDNHLGTLTLFMLALALGTMLLFVGFKGIIGISHIAFLLWGVSFGELVTIFQAAVTRQVDKGKDVATSLQSSTFNFGIVFGSVFGGVILERYSVFEIVILTTVLLIIPTLFSVFSKKTFWDSRSIEVEIKKVSNQ